MCGSSMIPIWVVLLVDWHYVYSSWMSFEMDASAIKSLLSGTYTILSLLGTWSWGDQGKGIMALDWLVCTLKLSCLLSPGTS